MTSLEPVRLHVPAKRYLCATRAEYLGKLSRASVLILKLQGGLMSLQVREWDDRGKIAGLETPDLGSYRVLIEGRSLSE